jgi:hexosaminidase
MSDADGRDRPAILPTPAEVDARSGSLAVARLTALTVSHEAVLPVAERFRHALLLWGGPQLPPPRISDSAAPGAVHVQLQAEAAGGESLSPTGDAASGEHTVSVDDRGVQVTAGTLEGLHRGLASLTQLLATGGGTVRHGAVRDHARFGWRGLSLDVARWFVPLDEVKRVIDLLSLYKLDVLHLHLTDNEGWRIEIRSWPALTGGPDAPTERAGAFYTQAELADLAAYAAERFVTLIPEIDLPGHAAAAIRAYPELGPAEGLTLEGPVPIAYLDAEAEAAQRFLADVLAEVAALTPGPFLHVGGDEAFGMDEGAHARLVTRAADIVRRLGKQVVGWQEASRADVGPGDTLQHWIDFVPGATSEQAPNDRRDEPASAIPADVQATLDAFFRDAQHDLGRIAAKGTRVLLSPTSHAYLDRPHAERSRDADQEAVRGRLGLPHYPPTPLRDYVEWDPAEVAPSVDPALILGVEGAVWGETITSEADLEALLLPRLVGVAEVAWAGTTAGGWQAFRERLAAHARMWSHAGWAWFQADSVDWGAPEAGPPTVARP